jgi:hypothetical protein
MGGSMITYEGTEVPELTRINDAIDDFDIKEYRLYLADKIDEDVSNIYQGPRLLRRRFGLNRDEAIEIFYEWFEETYYD